MDRQIYVRNLPRNLEIGDTLVIAIVGFTYGVHNAEFKTLAGPKGDYAASFGDIGKSAGDTTHGAGYIETVYAKLRGGRGSAVDKKGLVGTSVKGEPVAASNEAINQAAEYMIKATADVYGVPEDQLTGSTPSFGRKTREVYLKVAQVALEPLTVGSEITAVVSGTFSNQPDVYAAVLKSHHPWRPGQDSKVGDRITVADVERAWKDPKWAEGMNDTIRAAAEKLRLAFIEKFGPPAAPEQPALDLTKPVQTRDGRKARVIATDIKDKDGMQIAVAIKNEDDEEEVCTMHPSGAAHVNGHSPHPWDISNVPAHTETYWANHYPGQAYYTTEREAIKNCAPGYTTVKVVPTGD